MRERASSDTSFVTSPPDVLWNVQFNNLNSPGLSMSACGPGVLVDLRHADADAFSATLQCVSNSTSGTLSATWDGPAFVGTVTFTGQTQALRVALGGSPGGATAWTDR